MRTIPLKLTISFFTSLSLAAVGQAQGYDVVDLGAIAYDVSRGHDINEAGQITGDTLNTSGNWRAFLWSDHTMTEIPELTGYAGDYGYGYGMNNLGQIVGESGYTVPFLWDGSNTINLGNLGGMDSGAAHAVNDSTQVVGYASHTSGFDRAFLWENGTMTNLGTIGGTSWGRSEARDINNSGQVVGVSATNSGDQHAFLWENGVMTDLGGVSPGYSIAYGISENSFIVGASMTATYRSHATLWIHGSVVDLGTLKYPDPGSSEARDVNDHGQVVGWSHAHNTFGRHAFLFEAGVMKDLNDLLDPGTGWELEEAYAINGLGQITGYGQYNGHLRGFLLIPRDDSSLALSSPTPGTAGEVNKIFADNAVPGSEIYFAFGPIPGTTPVPGCPGLEVDIAFPVVSQPVHADSQGQAEFSKIVPASASGMTILIQAVEPSQCRVSNLVTYAFP